MRGRGAQPWCAAVVHAAVVHAAVVRSSGAQPWFSAARSVITAFSKESAELKSQATLESIKAPIGVL